MKKLLICFLFIILLLSGCDITNTNNYDKILENDTTYIENYYTSHPELINKRTRQGYVLNYACVNGMSLEKIEKLVDLGANLNIYDYQNECTPLTGLYKTKRDDIDEVAIFLLSRGADLNELSIINSASYDQNTKILTVDVCAIDEEPRFVYHLSENVVGYIIDNNLLEDKTRFVTIAFEGIYLSLYEEQQNNMLKIMENMELLDSYVDIISKLIPIDINVSGLEVRESLESFYLFFSSLLSNIDEKYLTSKIVIDDIKVLKSILKSIEEIITVHLCD